MQQTPTLVDTLGDGYRTINRRPLLLALPLLLNIYLWFGAQLSFAPLVNDIVGLVERMQPQSAAAADTTAVELFRSLGQTDMRRSLAVLNIIPTLPLNQIVDLGASTNVIQIGSIGGAVLAFVLINLLALPLSAGFLTRVSEAVRDERAPIRDSLRRAVRIGFSMLGASAILAAVGIALLLPFLVFWAILATISQAIAMFALSLVLLVVFWARIYLGFTNEAIVMGGLGPLRALQASFMVVRRQFWGTLGLLGLSWIISAGCMAIWLELIASSVGLVVALIGSAYVDCGLQAARMIFFQDRLRRWQERPQPSLHG